MAESQYQIYDAEQKRRYYTQMPNLIDDIHLSVFAFRLYMRFKRVAGESGECYQGLARLSKECEMSRELVTKSRKELESRGLIAVEEISNPNGGKNMLKITMTDIWLENCAIYDQMREDKKRENFYSNQTPEPEENQSRNIDFASKIFLPCKVEKSTVQGRNIDLKNIEDRKKEKHLAPQTGADAQPPKPEPKQAKEKTRKQLSEKALDLGAGGLDFLPPNLRPLGDAFIQEAGESYMPIKKDRTLWYKTLNEWAARRFSPDLVRAAIREMRAARPKPLTIGGPQSITKVAVSMIGNIKKDEVKIWHAGDDPER